MCKSACPVSRPRPSLMRDLNHVSSLLRVEKQSWCDKFVIWEAFIRPWNRKIGKTGYQKTLQRPLKGGGRSPPPPPPPMDPPHQIIEVGTLAVDGSAVTFGTARRAWGPAPSRCTKRSSPRIDGQCINHCIAIMMVRCSAL